ncbi:hypothetical protein QQP08_023063 [Theobroma cacao]|nr:hypothetical protein QQP08_023063 [Theobroma cacao]
MIKTKADLKDIAQAEADIINLKKKVDDLGMQLNQHLEKNSVSMNDSCNKHQPNHQAKMKDKPKGTEAAFKRSGSKDTYLDEAWCQNEKKQESSLANKHTPQNQQLDHSAHNSNHMHAAETAAQKPLAPSNSKKSATKGEGANSTSSALTKLTTRLNFLKERRSQIANEILGMEKGRGSGQAVPNPDKGKGSEPIQSLQNPEKGRGLDISQ